MGGSRPVRPVRRHAGRVRTRWNVRLADALVALWVLAWLALAVIVGIDVRRLGQLTDTLTSAGKAISQTGTAINLLSHLPFVGHDLARVSGQVKATGSSAVRSAATSRSSVDQLSYLLPIVVAAIPIVPILAIYLPLRIQRSREARAVLASAGAPGHNGHVEAFLAHRALSTLPFHRLEEISPDPWADLAAGKIDALAAAEMARLGLEPTAVLGGPGSGPNGTGG